MHFTALEAGEKPPADFQFLDDIIIFVFKRVGEEINRNPKIDELGASNIIVTVASTILANLFNQTARPKNYEDAVMMITEIAYTVAECTISGIKDTYYEAKKELH